MDGNVYKYRRYSMINVVMSQFTAKLTHVLFVLNFLCTVVSAIPINVKAVGTLYTVYWTQDICWTQHQHSLPLSYICQPLTFKLATQKRNAL